MPIRWSAVPRYATGTERFPIGDYAVALCEACTAEGWQAVEYADGQLAWKKTPP